MLIDHKPPAADPGSSGDPGTPDRMYAPPVAYQAVVAPQLHSRPAEPAPVVLSQSDRPAWASAEVMTAYVAPDWVLETLIRDRDYQTFPPMRMVLARLARAELRAARAEAEVVKLRTAWRNGGPVR